MGSNMPTPNEDITTPFEYVRQIFGKNIIKTITEQSNLYAHQKDGKVLDMSEAETEQLLGIWLQIGIVKMPASKIY